MCLMLCELIKISGMYFLLESYDTMLNHLRYERVKAVQKTGETTRDMWHKADWDQVKKNPSSIQLPREDWIFRFDAESNARESFESALQRVQEVN